MPLHKACTSVTSVELLKSTKNKMWINKIKWLNVHCIYLTKKYARW